MSIKRLQKEFSELSLNPPSTFYIGQYEEDIHEWDAVFVGPEGTPYEEGIFKLKIKFPKEYPFKPPKVKFVTKIFHPNVSCDGEYCISCGGGSCCEHDLLSHECWNPHNKVRDVLQQIEGSLKAPSECYINNIVGAIYNHDKAKFEEMAKEWTENYAQGE